eukprot:5118309-Prymnesium_polylepis.1
MLARQFLRGVEEIQRQSLCNLCAIFARSRAIFARSGGNKCANTCQDTATLAVMQCGCREHMSYRGGEKGPQGSGTKT